MDVKIKIKIAILTDLEKVPSGYLQPHAAVIANASLSVSPGPTKVEIERAVTELEQDGFIHGVRNQLTGERKWQITDSGRLALADM